MASICRRVTCGTISLCLCAYLSICYSFAFAGEKPIRVSPAHPLTTQQISNLAAFAKVFGYVRYFHPSDACEKLDWNEFSVYGAGRVAGARGVDDLINRLRELFNSIAPTITIGRDGGQVSGRATSAVRSGGSGSRTIAWAHRGHDFTNPYKYRRERVQKSAYPEELTFPDPEKPYVTEFAPGIYCAIPLALHADSTGTLPHGGAGMYSSAAKGTPGAERPETSWADVIVGWNLLQHFYPYFDIVHVDWDQILGEALKRAADDSTAVRHFETMRWMQAQTKDGHGVASQFFDSYHRSRFKFFQLPFTVDWIQNKLVVTSVIGDAGPGVAPGDIVRSVERMSPEDYLFVNEQFIPGPGRSMRRWWSTFLFSQPRADSLSIEFERSPGQVRTFRKSGGFAPVKMPHAVGHANPRDCGDGIFYVDLGSWTFDSLEASARELADARALVFDIRSYPNIIGGDDLISHLIDGPIPAPRYLRVLVGRPDRKDMYFKPELADTIRPRSPRFRGKVVFLTGPRAMSKAEHILLMIDHYGLGKIVGGHTAGTLGNSNIEMLPSGYGINWTASRAEWYNGSLYFGGGIAPRVEVKKTIDGVMQQRDEVLERAIELLKKPD